MPRGISSPVTRRRFASERSSQTMKRQPAARCCELSAFCAAVCTNESSSCRTTDMLESRLARSWTRLSRRIGSVFGHLAADRVLEGSHVRSVQRLRVRCEFPLDVAQFDVWQGVAHDPAKFLRNVLWCIIQNQEPGYQLQESVLRDQVRRRVGRAGAETVVHEGALDRSSLH